MLQLANISHNLSRSFIWLSLLCCWLFINQTSLNAQKQYKRTQLTTEKGLAHNYCHAVQKDAKGFLWLGTQDGLSRFDGYNFKIFRHDDTDSTSMSSNIISAIAADKNGKFWVTMNGGGVNYFDPLSVEFTGFQHFVTPVHPRLSTLGGLCFFDPKKKEFHRLNCGETVEDLKMRRKGLAYGVENALLLGLNKNFLSIQLDKKQSVAPTNLPIHLLNYVNSTKTKKEKIALEPPMPLCF